MRSKVNMVGYVIQYGYFQRDRKFYLPKNFRETDIEFISKKMGFGEKISLDSYDDSTRLRHKKHILEIHACHLFGALEKKLVSEYCSYLSKSSLNPVVIYRELNRYIAEKRFETPSYWMITDIIANAINDREQGLLKIIGEKFPKAGESIVAELLNDDSIDNIDMEKRKSYRLSFFKNINKDLKPKLVSETVEKIRILNLYNGVFVDLIKLLDINFDGLKYFSDFVLISKVSQLNQMSNEKKKLYIISFIYVTYYYLNDIASERLLREVQTNENSINIKFDMLRATERDNDAKRTKSVLCGVKDVLLPLQLRVLSILARDDINADTKVELALDVYNEQSDVVKKTEAEVDEYYAKTNEILDKVEWYIIMEKESVKLQKRVAPIILILDFEYKCNCSLLTSAIRYFKNNNGMIDKNAPQGFLKPKVRNLLYRNNGTFRQSLYKSLLIHSIGLALKGGNLNVLHSRKFQEFEQFMISEKELNENSKELLRIAGLNIFEKKEQHLESLKHDLTSQIRVTNDNILNGSNEHITFKDNCEFVIKTDALENIDHEKLSSLLPNKLNINITELLNSVNQHANFTDSFIHFSNRYVTSKPSPDSIIATILALGLGIGLGKMQTICLNMHEDLVHIATLYCSPENFRHGNNEVLKTIDRLPLSKIYGKNTGTHTSSDGAKFNILTNSLDCSPTYKSQGTGSGVSVYIFADDSHKMFYSVVFNSSEKEAHYVIDGLMENDVVRSEIHSTDTAGYSEVIFGTTHLLGFKFAPRIKNLKNQVLYLFPGPKEFAETGYKLIPEGKINVDLIYKYWDMILRFVATIKLKKTSASDLFRRLNSYSKDSPFYQALKEYGRIIKTKYILEYLNDHALRQRIEKQLNIIESIQKFSRAVSTTGKYDFSSNIREEQLMMEGAKLLIQNAILCWNYMYFSKLIYQAKSYREKARILKAVKNGSPIFWKHINFFGIFDFSVESLKSKILFNFRDLEKVKI